MPNHTDLLPESLQLPFLFDTKKLKESLKTLEREYWVDHFITKNYQGDWAVLPLTSQRENTHPILMASSIPSNYDFVPTEFLGKAPYLQEVLAQFEAKYLSVRLMRLGPQSEIKEHRDFDLDELEVRLHIPILTNEQVSFYLNEKKIRMLEGECWYLRLSDPHRVVNESNQARVHLVMDFVLNDWLKNLLIPDRRTAASATP